MNNNFRGSCLCGKVKYEVLGDFESFFLCHCKFCQKDTGSAHSANLFSSTSKLNWLSGERVIKTSSSTCSFSIYLTNFNPKYPIIAPKARPPITSVKNKVPTESNVMSAPVDF